MGPSHAKLCPPVCGAGDGGCGAIQRSAPTTQADFRPLEAKAGDSSTGRAVYLFGGDLNGDFCAA